MHPLRHHAQSQVTAFRKHQPFQLPEEESAVNRGKINYFSATTIQLPIISCRSKCSKIWQTWYIPFRTTDSLKKHAELTRQQQQLQQP